MENTTLLVPTLHIEVLLTGKVTPELTRCISSDVAQALREEYESLAIDVTARGYEEVEHAAYIQLVAVVDYTGPTLNATSGHHKLEDLELDIQTYHLHNETNCDEQPRRRISQPEDDESEFQQARILSLPNAALQNEWESLIYDDALPSQLLRYLARMLGVMKQPGLNLSTFNWNRLCLLHGPPGSGKSTLCRALAQKLSIRLSQTFPNAVLVEVDTNNMLSKYFGESGKLITALFEKIHALAQSPTTLVCIVMDEVETIAGSREKVAAGGECSDGLRATNQLLTALDRVRSLPNIIIMCTSNLLDAIDPAFLDRVDIKQLIPCPSPAAIYNIFRSCLNELVRSSLVDVTASTASSRFSESVAAAASPSKLMSSSPENWNLLSMPTIPTLSEVKVRYFNQPTSLGYRVWALSQDCQGFSGRTLRRLPILGLAMYTWGGSCTLQDAVTALESAIKQELVARHTR